jgi:hypothetical protein
MITARLMRSPGPRRTASNVSEHGHRLRRGLRRASTAPMSDYQPRYDPPGYDPRGHGQPQHDPRGYDQPRYDPSGYEPQYDQGPYGQAPTASYPPAAVIPPPPAPPTWGYLPGQQPAPQPRRRKRSRTLLVVLLSGFCVLAIAGSFAVAKPILRITHAEKQWKATRVSLPDSFNGVHRNTSAKATRLAKSFGTGTPVGPDNVGLYGSVGSHEVVIIAIRAPAAMTDSAQRLARNAFIHQFDTGDKPLTSITSVPPGALGGSVECGVTSDHVHVCLATDAGSMVATVAGADVTTDSAILIREAREATVSRGGQRPAAGLNA